MTWLRKPRTIQSRKRAKLKLKKDLCIEKLFLVDQSALGGSDPPIP